MTAFRASVLSPDIARVIPLVGGILILVLGTIFALYNPPFQVADEPAHFYRAYEVTMGSCRDSRSVRLPTDITTLNRRFPDHLNELEAVDNYGDRLHAALHEPSSTSFVQYDDGGATSAYSCLTYVPAALGVSVARLLHLPAVDVLYAARLANVVVFAALATLTLALLPLGLRPVALLLLAMPMSLSEAASSAQDPLLNGLGILFVAYVASLAWSSRATPVGKREIAILLASGVVLSQCKIDFVLLPLVLLVPPERWAHGRRAQLATAAGAVALGLAGLALWQHFGFSAVNSSTLLETHRVANERFMLHEPGLIVQRFAATLELNRWFYLDSFIGRLGWLDVELPSWMTLAYAAALVAATLLAPAPAALTPLRRMLCLSVVAVAISGLFFVFIAIENTSTIAMQFATGQGYYEGVQGRYFIPFAMPLALAFAGLLPARLRLTPTAFTVWAFAGAMVTACVASGGAYAAIYREFIYPQHEATRIPYRLRHPAPFFEGQYIHQVGGGPSEGQILYVHHGLRYWIESARFFRKHHLVVKPKDLPATTVRRIRWGGVIWDPDTQFHPTSEAVKYDSQFALDSGNRVWLVTHGVRHRILDSRYIYRDGFPVARPSARELAAIPIGDPVEDFHYLDGQLVQSSDAPDPAERARVFEIENGGKRWIIDPAWLSAHGRSLSDVRTLPFATVDRIPDGYPLR